MLKAFLEIVFIHKAWDTILTNTDKLIIIFMLWPLMIIGIKTDIKTQHCFV